MSNKGKGKKNSNRIPELLAPAGSKEAFIAAVEAGADAIYCGGKLFNARMSADNFDLDEMAEAVAFAHKRLVKVYVTVNTLINDEEIDEALEYVEKLWEIGVDALILQDIGLAYLVHKEFPDFPIHLSTQGTVYNLDGVRIAAKLGFSRVVLARELSLNEINLITEGISNKRIQPAKSDSTRDLKSLETLKQDGDELLRDEGLVEIEVFCHGALCYCYSGQCQMSRAIGGRSANRGACAQPCRMKYEEGFSLSPKDFSSIDYLAEFRDAGVRSLKIEGRMKSPEYVSTVVSIYRKYLDELYLKGSYEVSLKDRKRLAQAFSRGFTDLNLTGDEKANDIMSGASPKNKGLEVGSVISQKPIGKKTGKNDRYLLDADLTEELNLGDILEIEGYPDSSFTLTYMEKVGTNYRLGDIKTVVKPGSKVNRLVSAELNRDVSIYFKSKDWTGSKYIRKVPLEIDVTGTSYAIVVTYKEPITGVSAKVELTGIEVDSGEADCRERIVSSLSKLGGSSFDVSKIRMHGEFGFALPVKDINALRREAIAKLEEKLVGRREAIAKQEEKLVGKREAIDIEKSLVERKKEIETNKISGRNVGNIIELYLYEIPEKEAPEIFDRLAELMGTAHANRMNPAVIFPAAEIDRINSGLKKLTDEFQVPLIPYVSNVSKGIEEELIITNLDAIKSFCIECKTPIYLGNLSQIELFADFVDEGVELRYDFGVNVFNKWATVAANSLGLKEGAPSLETEGHHFGAKPLMIIGHDNPLSEIQDRRGRRYILKKPEYSDQIRLVEDTTAPYSGVLCKLGENTDGIIRYYII